MSTSRFLAFFSIALPLLLCPLEKGRAAETCQIIPEVIHKLYAPRTQTPTLWDLFDETPTYAETFYDALPLSEKEFIVAGAAVTTETHRPILKKVNKLGRKLWIWPEKTSAGRTPDLTIHFLQDQGSTFIAAGQIYKKQQANSIWFGQFSKDGKLLKEASLSEKNRTLSLAGVTPAIDQKGWIVAVNETRGTEQFSRFIAVDETFRKQSERYFLPGGPNTLLDIQNFTDNVGRHFYVAVGEMTTSSQQTAGMVILLDQQLKIIWQRTYSRGSGMRFSKVLGSQQGQILALGTARPVNPEAPVAATIFALDPSNGLEHWQRYYMRDDLGYEGKDLMVSDNGTLHLLMAGTKDTADNFQEHARLLTLTPRGETITDHSYSTGEGVRPERLVWSADHTPLISGQATMKNPDPQDPRHKFELADKGWLLAANAFTAYKDPCKKTTRAF